MARKSLLFLVPLMLLAPAMSPSVSAASVPSLPEGYENFTPEIDYASLMGNAVTAGGDMSCTMTSSNIDAFPVGTPFDPKAIQNDLLNKGPRFIAALGDPTKEGVAGCSVNVVIPAGLRSITGTVDNAALAGLNVPTSGSFSLDCELATTISATAAVRFGGKVPGKIDVVATGADNPVPFNCAIALAFGTNTLNGSVTGSVSVVDPTVAGVCDGSATISCVPIQMNDATVTITSSTGRFGGLTGSGTYSFVDSFSLPFIDSDLKAIPFANVSTSSVRKSDVRKASGASEAMTLTLGKAATRTAISRPITSNLSANERIFVTGAAKASCTLSAKVGRKSTTLTKFTLDAKGQVPAKSLAKTAFTTKVAKAIGAKKNSKVAVTATCKAGKQKATTAKRTLTYLG